MRQTIPSKGKQMRTKEALEKLNNLDNVHKTYLENRRKVYKISPNPEPVRTEILGYLRGITNSGVITEPEFKALFTYYTL